MSDDFVFPTEDDVKLAKELKRRGFLTPNDAGTMATALRLVAERAAVPPHYLTMIRERRSFISKTKSRLI